MLVGEEAIQGGNSRAFVGRGVEAGMSNDAQELPNDEDRQPPDGRAGEELTQCSQRCAVLWELFSMGIDEDIRVHRYQRRPSIHSYKDSRSLMSTPGG